MSDPHIIEELARAALSDRHAADKYSKELLLEMIRHVVVSLDYAQEELALTYRPDPRWSWWRRLLWYLKH